MSTSHRKVQKKLPEPALQRQTTQSISKIPGPTFLALAALVATFLFTQISHKQFWHRILSDLDTKVNLFPQAPELIPVKNNALWQRLAETYGTEAYKWKAVDWLSRAIQIPTESYDQMDPVGIDPRWEKFAVFHDYLARAFPLLHSALELTKVNTYGLIYVWKGANDSMKPLLLTAHQDVVPVDPATYDAWTFPPFSGHFDGNLIWGRGSIDDKGGLIGILSAIETMLENGFQPARTVVIALGFDEESGGTYAEQSHPTAGLALTSLYGAQTLTSKLLEMFGENGYAMLVDEGAGYGEQHGRVIATPGIAEKGKVNVMIEVTMPGGHSSLPPPHTSIGFLAGFLIAFEKNPFDVHLARGSPVYKNYQCLAQYAPGLPDSLRRDIIDAEHSDKALQSAEQELFKDPKIKNLVGTTQAIDLVNGGIKVNALPEHAYAVINHRIAIESSVAATLNRDVSLVQPLAQEYNLSFAAFDVDMDRDPYTPGRGNVTLSTVFEDPLEPAPITPTGEDASPYRILSGSIKAAYNSHRGISGDEHIIVCPGVMSGNTDTRYYWKLTPHIFRYGHTGGVDGGAPPGIHTVNEAISASSFVEIIRFFSTLILNMDETLFV